MYFESQKSSFEDKILIFFCVDIEKFGIVPKNFNNFLQPKLLKNISSGYSNVY